MIAICLVTTGTCPVLSYSQEQEVGVGRAVLGDEPEEFVINRYRDANTNLQTQLMRIIERAGLKPWPKLLENLRSTPETELAEQYPIHVVCEWLGNTKADAAKHCLQVTDAHFQRATQNPTQGVQNPQRFYP